MPRRTKKRKKNSSARAKAFAAHARTPARTARSRSRSHTRTHTLTPTHAGARTVVDAVDVGLRERHAGVRQDARAGGNVLASEDAATLAGRVRDEHERVVVFVRVGADNRRARRHNERRRCRNVVGRRAHVQVAQRLRKGGCTGNKRHFVRFSLWWCALRWRESAREIHIRNAANN